MIAAVKAQGSSMGGLVNYLLGPGRDDEHVVPRVVAVSSDVTAIPVGVELDGGQRRSLGVQLGLYGQMFPPSCPAAGPVYHVVFSLPAGERLTDEQWAAVAADTARVLHLERPSGAVGSRAVGSWAAFCHGPSSGGFEHMHFAASLVRSDGSEVRTYLRNGYRELHDVARRAEERHGLAVVAGRDHGSVPVAQRAEREACARRGRVEPERDTLARTVRSVAAAAGSEAEFVSGLRASGVAVRARHGTGGRGEVTGYSVAVRSPVETDTVRAARVAAGRPAAKPVWFGGGRLGRDLSLPALRARWESGLAGGGSTGPGSSARAGSNGGGLSPDELSADGLSAEVRAVRDEARARWAGQRAPVDFSPAAAAAAVARNQPGGRAWQRAADRLGQVNRLAADPARLGGGEWRSLAWEAAGATSSLARRIEVDGPGPLSAAARSLAQAAQRPVHGQSGPATASPDPAGPALAGPALAGPALAGPALAGPALAGPALAGPALGDTRRRLRGVASVCAAHRLGASGRHAEGWLRVVAELARLGETLSKAAAARDELDLAVALTAAASRDLQAAHDQLTARPPAHLDSTAAGYTPPADAPTSQRPGDGPLIDATDLQVSGLQPHLEQPDLDRPDGPGLGR